jgi:hypothetical protein
MPKMMSLRMQMPDLDQHISRITERAPACCIAMGLLIGIYQHGRIDRTAAGPALLEFGFAAQHRSTSKAA